MPVYNGARFLREQLDSILSQTFADFELIAVDDASGDASLSILQAYAQRDSRIRLHRNESNQGQVRTLAAQLPRARAHWIALADQDDIWLEKKLASLMAVASPHAAAYCNSELIDERGISLGVDLMQAVMVSTPASGHDPYALWEKNCVSGHAMIFHRRLLPHFLPFLPPLPHDHQIAIAALVHGGLHYCPERLVRHRIHDANASNRHLLSAMEAARAKPEHGRGTRLMRRRRHRQDLQRRVDYYCARGIAPAHWLRMLDLDRFEAQWFDARMFWLMLWHPVLVGHPPPLLRLRRAYKHCKGARWYAMGAAWASGLSRLRAWANG